jgi:uncharacterized protein (TIGR03437 family)
MKRTCCAVALLIVTRAFAQPVIGQDGIVNAASHTSAVAPGSVAAVLGSFAVSAPAVGGTPLPTSLAQLSMQFDGTIAAPLFYVSSQQVNIQIPWGLPWQSQTTLTATVADRFSAPQTVDLVSFAPGIFTLDGTQGAIQNAAFQIVDRSNPATAGSTVVTIYCTGLGDPVALATAPPTVTIGGAIAHVLSAGLAEGLVGVYQVSAMVPARSVVGDAVPVTTSIGGFTSNDRGEVPAGRDELRRACHGDAGQDDAGGEDSAHPWRRRSQDQHHSAAARRGRLCPGHSPAGHSGSLSGRWQRRSRQQCGTSNRPAVVHR